MNCPSCNEIVIKETNKDIDYPYVCLDCDENFYTIELIKGEQKWIVIRSMDTKWLVTY